MNNDTDDDDLNSIAYQSDENDEREPGCLIYLGLSSAIASLVLNGIAIFIILKIGIFEPQQALGGPIVFVIALTFILFGVALLLGVFGLITGIVGMRKTYLTDRPELKKIGLVALILGSFSAVITIAVGFSVIFSLLNRN